MRASICTPTANRKVQLMAFDYGYQNLVKCNLLTELYL